jgi:hypothetical protein
MVSIFRAEVSHVRKAANYIYNIYIQDARKFWNHGNFNYFPFFIYRLKLKAKGLKMALTLDERVEIVLLSGRPGWCMLLKSEIFVTLGRELQTLVLLSISIF